MNSCDAQILDLREPPSREAVGLPEGEGIEVSSCQDGLDLTVRLPEDVTVEMETRDLIVRTDDLVAGTGPPTGVDILSTSLSRDDAADLATRIADTLGMDHAQIEAWRVEAENPPDPTLDTKTRFIRGGAGYVQAELQVIHQSGEDDDRNNVHLLLSLRR